MENASEIPSTSTTYTYLTVITEISGNFRHYLGTTVVLPLYLKRRFCMVFVQEYNCWKTCALLMGAGMVKA